jgi:hypothetical protein
LLGKKFSNIFVIQITTFSHKPNKTNINQLLKAKHQNINKEQKRKKFYLLMKLMIKKVSFSPIPVIS